jgi:hypothetical protein
VQCSLPLCTSSHEGIDSGSRMNARVTFLVELVGNVVQNTLLSVRRGVKMSINVYEVTLPLRGHTVFARICEYRARKHGGLITYFQINRDDHGVLYRVK